MRFFHPTVLSVLCITYAWALHESDVGVVDWHKNLVGVPLFDSLATAPVFHRVGDESTQSVVLTATGSNVLAAINPLNGSLAWRHIFESEDDIVVFQKHKDVVAALSGPGGSMLRAWDALSGHLLLEQRLHTTESGRASKPNNLGSAIAFIANTASPYEKADLLVLSNGHTMRYMDGSTGEYKWTWLAEDQSSLVIHTDIIATPSVTYVIGLAKSLASYTLHVTALSTATGDVLSTKHVPSTVVHGHSDFIALNSNDSTIGPRIVWLEYETIMSFPLEPLLRGKPSSLKWTNYKQIVDVGLSMQGNFVAVKTDGSSRVVRLDAEPVGLKSAWEFKDTGSSNSKSEPPVYAGGFDKDGQMYITRLYWSQELQRTAVDVFAPHLAEGKGLLSTFSVPFKTVVHGIINHIAIDVANPAGWPVETRLLMCTSTGVIQLWQQDQLQWTREEALANIIVAEFVELPERKVLSSHVGEGQESFMTRLSRQIADAQDFPQYLISFVKRFATGSDASSATSPSNTSTPTRDAFGFRQIIVAATPFGKIFGIDSSNGDILWSRVLGLGRTAEVGGQVQPAKLFVTRTVNDGDSPQVVLVTQRRAANALVDTVIFHINALTGADARGESQSGLLQGLDIMVGPLVESYLLQNEHRIVLLLDEFLQMHVYPNTPENQAALHHAAPSVHFPLRTISPGQKRIMGHQLVLNDALSDMFVAYPTWTLSFSPGEDIQSMIPASRGLVASLGKVLGNRTTLYKYLNPRLFIILTLSDSVAPSTCGIYLVDSTKGTIVYHASLPSRAGVCDVKATLTENWLVYHYYDDDFSGVGQAKGYRLVTVELYEGQQADEKTKSSAMSSFSNMSVKVTAFEQSYVFPHDITAIATTSTKFGITAKDIIVANHNHQIQSYPRTLLNPRRPNRKTTAEEQEEYLTQYDPILPNDPRRILSHNYKVAKTHKILTAPALLESTSLVFAYGLDLFVTRVAPSNTFDVLSENFNKAQLVLTISGLAVAIMVTKPITARKRLRERWYE